MSPRSAYLYQLRPSRPDLPETLTPAEQAVIGDHFAYLQRLLAADQLVIAGRTQDYDPLGLCIFYADSPEQAQEIANNDPAVVKGVMTVTVRPYGIALLKGRD
ncbi:uncharacterized protein YciI [Tumebacillus sp. BK434]|uniref:YciI family protein n=1 Tax=Tumebacillus sp. BK434 TaxID=2512169 RepID=UPI0010445AB9|nr:YciI family protein [Tumebacillus sp. BK434]TCP58114.1 uncharacterized protein YciI [Tumebacillus sp. BK434]